MSDDEISLDENYHNNLHTVTFKCIGAVQDKNCQIVLRDVSEILRQGRNVDLKLECEPSNPYDSKAIMFICKLEDWKKIGYVVNEALSDVHQALSENSITSIRFAWVKYKVQWKTPGFYAAN